jgi:hypothetical protein
MVDVYVRMTPGPVPLDLVKIRRTEEVFPGVLLDLDENRRLLGVEVLGVEGVEIDGHDVPVIPDPGNHE